MPTATLADDTLLTRAAQTGDVTALGLLLERHRALESTFISGLDEHGEPDLVDDRAALDALKVPTLVVVGRFDVMCGPRWAEELHELIPGSKLLVLERSGHFGHLEESDLLAREVAAFVTATSATA